MSRDFVRDIAVSGILPWVSVFVLQRAGVSLIVALGVSTTFPLADGIITFVRKRAIDAIGMVNIGFLLASMAFTFLTGNVHIVMLKGAFLTGAFSLLCLGSLLAPKPLLYYFGRQTTTRGDPVLMARWDANWELPGFRRVLRLMTVVWGIGLAFEVIVRVITVYRLPPLTALALAPFITYGTLGALMAWTIAYRAAMIRKYGESPATPESS